MLNLIKNFSSVQKQISCKKPRRHHYPGEGINSSNCLWTKFIKWVKLLSGMAQKLKSIDDLKAYMQSLREKHFSGTMTFNIEAGKIVRIYEEPDTKKVAIPANIGVDNGA